MATVVIAIGQNYWGKGDNDLEALREFKRQGGLARLGYSLLTFGEGSEFEGVDQMGYVHWTGAEPTRQEITAR